MAFPRWVEPLDIDHPTGKVYNYKFELAEGDSITDAIVEVMDDSSTNVDPLPATTITEIAFAVISGRIWGVSFRAQGGVGGFICVRCRYDTALENGDDATWRLFVRQN